MRAVVDGVTYEVTAEVEPALADAYEAWLRDEHVPALLATGCFAGASVRRAASRFRIQYDARDRAQLERYLAEHAPRLRDDGLRRFPAGVRLERDEWVVVARWPA